MDNNEFMNEENNQDTGKRMSIAKAGGIIFALLLVFVFILIFARGCSVSKNVEEKGTEKNSSEVVLVDKNNSSDSGNKNSESGSTSSEPETNEVGNGSETEGNTGEISSTESTENPSENPGNSGGVVIDGKENIYKVDAPKLGALTEMTVMVSGKSIYKTEGTSYAYAIGLIFPSEDGYIIVRYFCPKKTYDAVVTGDTVTVKFQLDENGFVAITSISK